MKSVAPASASVDPDQATSSSEHGSGTVRERSVGALPDSVAHPGIPEPSVPEPSGTAVDPEPAPASPAASDLRWLLDQLVDEVPGAHTAVVVSSDGLLLLSSDPAHAAAPSRATDGPGGASGDLATIVSGLGSLTVGAARLMDAGEVRQTVIAMDQGNLFVMSISDGSLLGVHATEDCDMNVVAYQMGLFVGRAGHVLTPAVRSELRLFLDPGADPTAPVG